MSDSIFIRVVPRPIGRMALDILRAASDDDVAEDLAQYATTLEARDVVKNGIIDTLRSERADRDKTIVAQRERISQLVTENRQLRQLSSGQAVRRYVPTEVHVQ